jgi:hypothetical protein
MIFNESHEDDSRPKLARESFYEFLDRSSLEPCTRIRSLINELVDQYPPSDQADVIGRLKSSDESDFRSALFEIVLYRLLCRFCDEVAVHPPLENGFKPDFGMLFDDGSKIYVEAVLASERNGLTPSGQRLIETTLEHLNAHAHHSFRLAVESSGEPSVQPSAKVLKGRIHSWLDSLNPDAECAEEELWSVFDIEGWSLSCRAIPLKPEQRGSSPRLLWSKGNGANWVNRSDSIRDAIVAKANKYGKLDAPLIVAVNCNCFALREHEELDALFGDLRFNFIQDRPDLKAWPSRASNGAWYGRNGPRYKGVCAAWIFRDLQIYSLSIAEYVLYINPWSRLCLPSSLLELSNYRIDSKDGRLYPGLSTKTMLGLGDDWPSNKKLTSPFT